MKKATIHDVSMGKTLVRPDDDDDAATMSVGSSSSSLPSRHPLF